MHFLDEKICLCPCGGGFGTIRRFGDSDGNFEYEPEIFCSRCRDFWRAEEVRDASGHVSWFWLPKEATVFQYPSIWDICDPRIDPAINFVGWVCEEFSKSDLAEVKKDMAGITNVKKLQGKAKTIVNKMRSATGHASILLFRKAIESAIADYDKYAWNAEIRKKVRHDSLEKQLDYWHDLIVVAKPVLFVEGAIVRGWPTEEN